MRVRLEFTSGIPTRTVQTDGSVEELLFKLYGSRTNFENMGGKAVILAPTDTPVVAEKLEEATPVEEEAPKPKRKTKAA